MRCQQIDRIPERAAFGFAQIKAFANQTYDLVYLTVRAHHNLSILREKRRELIQRSEAINLPKMLQALGIGVGRYFYKVPPGDIEKSVENCESCESENDCNEKLRIPELNPDDVDFCPSRDQLSQYSRAKRKR